MSMRLKYILSIVASICTVAILISAFALTMAKYRNEIDGYTHFKAESFNAAILLPEATPTKIVKTLSSFDFRPGMEAVTNTDGSAAEGDTAARTPFLVQNGTNASNTTSTALEYTVKIRTGNNLPLKYTLHDVNTGKYYRTNDTITELEGNNVDAVTGETVAGETRYEYSFYRIPIIGTDESDPSDREAKFRLPQGTSAEPLVIHEFELIAEWTSDPDPMYASSNYMKEVELVEIVVTVTSLNMLDNPPTVITPDYHANGIVVLRPTPDGVTNDFSYDIDLRAFHTELGQTNGHFEISLDNGVAMGVSQGARYIRYNLKFKVPVELTQDEGYSFALLRKSSNGIYSTDLLAAATVEYRLYDMMEQTYEVFETVADAEATGYDAVRYKLYAVYDLGLTQNNVFENKKYDLGGSTPQHESHTYRLTSNKLTEEFDEVAFLNKLELIVEADYINDLTERPRDTEAEETTEAPPSDG